MHGGNDGGDDGGRGNGGAGSNSGTGDSNQRHCTSTGDARVQSWSTLVEEARKETLLAPSREGFGAGTSDERFGRTRGSEEREEKDAVREAFELREAFEAELREDFEAEVREDFLWGTDGVNWSLRCESVGDDAPEPEESDMVSVHSANLGGRGGGDVQDWSPVLASPPKDCTCFSIIFFRFVLLVFCFFSFQ